MAKTIMSPTKTTSTKSKYKILTLGREHAQSAKELFVKDFCDYEPVTKHLGITYSEYEPFASEVIDKAVKDGLSVVAVDENNKVIACTIAEDITDSFHPHLEKYPKMKPIFALIESMTMRFLKDKKFLKGKMSHTWIAMVDKSHQGSGVSTEIDLACTNLAASKGFDFTYCEFTSSISERIVNHYQLHKKVDEIRYEDFTFEGKHPFEGVKGGASTWILGIKPRVTLENLKACYTGK